MNVLAPPHEAEAATAEATTTRLDRLVAALPLASVYVWLSVVYVVESWSRVTPWLFTDELELTQLSRSIADTGRAARRGQPHFFESLYTVLTAPVWLIHDVGTAYATLKYVDSLVMASVVFPTYFLARMVVGRRAALFAAAGAGAIPSLAYSSWIVEETFAYPYAALCLYLIAKALVDLPRSKRPLVVAIVAAAIAPVMRGELVVIPTALGLALLFALWSSEWARSRRASWSLGDWIGTIALVLGVIFVFSGFMSKHSQQWFAVTTYYKHRIIVLGDWAAGALAIGTGVVPMVAGLAMLFRAPGEQPSRELRMFRCVSLAGLIGFGWYTGAKAAYLSTVFATRVEERNLIYIVPLLFVGTALWVERRRINPYALTAAAVYVAYLLIGTPYEMQIQLYSDALGLAIVQQGNRFLLWTPSFAHWLMLAILAGTTAILAAPRFLGGRVRVAGALAALLAVAVVGWNLTGEIAAAAGTNSISRTQAATLRHPFGWVDDVAKGRPTLYMGQGVADQTPEWLLEFWNRSIKSVSSLDGTIGGPGPAGGPNFAIDGALTWPKQFDYAVEDWPCVDFAGTLRARHSYRAGGGFRQWRLIQLTHPNRMRAMCTGIYPDGWSGKNDASYYRFSGGSGGWLHVVFSRRDWSGPTGPSPVHIQVGPLEINPNQQPQIKKVTRDIVRSINSRQTKDVWIKAPGPRFGVRVIVYNKFVPHDVDPSSTDVRLLGAEISFAFTKHPPPAKQRTGT